MDELNDFILREFAQEAKGPETPPTEIPVVTEKKSTEEVKTSTSDKPVVEPQDSNAAGSKVENEPVNQTPTEEVEVDWDSFIVDKKTPEGEVKPQIDISALSETLGFSGVKSQDELVTKIKELQSGSNPALNTSGLPDHLVEAIQIARSNGDYLAYLGVTSVDYSKMDPEDLFEDQVEDLFYDDKGNFDEDGYYDYIDSLNEKEKKLRGRQIQKELIASQERSKEQLKQLAINRRNEELRVIQNELNSIKDLNGFQIKDHIKKEVFEDFATGKYKENLGIVTRTGGQDFKKSIETYMKAKYFDAFKQFLETKIKNSEKRSVHEELSNSSITSTPKLENPVNSKKPEGVDAYLMDIMSKINK